MLLDVFRLAFHQARESGLECLLVLGCLGLILCCLLTLDGLLELSCLVLSHQALQAWYVVKEVRNLIQRAETTETVEGSNGESHLGLVVVIRVVLRVLLVELLGEFLVGVGLNGQSLVDGQDLEQERQLLLVLLRDLL